MRKEVLEQMALAIASSMDMASKVEGDDFSSSYVVFFEKTALGKRFHRTGNLSEENAEKALAQLTDLAISLTIDIAKEKLYRAVRFGEPIKTPNTY